MKKIVISFLSALAVASASSNTTTSVVNDPFEQMDKLFQMQMNQMQQMQKQMDETFKVFEQSNVGGSKIPVMFSSGGMMSSGIQDKGDFYEVDLKIAKAAKTEVNVKTENGILTIKVEQTKDVVSSYIQSFTLPKDADSNKNSS